VRVAILRGVVTSLASLVVGALCHGCFFTVDCTEDETCPHHDGGLPAGCDPSKASGAVADTCGVFVSPKGDDKNVGTKAKPLKTLKAALARSATVYACAGATPFDEAVSIDQAATLFGGLDCATWIHDASAPTQLTAGADEVPLRISAKVEVADFAFTAASTAQAGGSSIAVVASNAEVSFSRCVLTAGDAQNGAAGMSGGAQEAQAEGGTNGDDASGAGASGGQGGTNAVCSLSGGVGGSGGGTPSGAGVNGAAGDNGSGGANGIGQTSSAACTNGANGNPGTAGTVGTAAGGTGSIDESGYHASDGGDGSDGGNGRSGGGGGGSTASATLHGAGGGGGGAGGCGGKLGTGGKGGGSSIALVSIASKVMLTSCALASGKGASGGAGGDGQYGQLGGAAGSGGSGDTMNVDDGCAGGKGGKGGNGGNGGGGLGGHSLGIAVSGAMPTMDAATKGAIKPGANGLGGKGGNVNASANQGGDGMSAACWNFGSGAACVM
jgi:hypothetical protein